jgi:Flp pilus assembly pilin Flp
VTAYPGSSVCTAQPFVRECNLNCINEMWRPLFGREWRPRCYNPKRGGLPCFTRSRSHERNILMKNVLMRLWKEEEGQDLIEYALLIVLMSLAAIGSIGGLATAVNGVFAKASANLT